MPLALLIMLLTGGGTGLASGASLPGDLLYPVKIHVNENFESVLAFTPKQEARVEVGHITERIKEIERLTSKGKLTIEKNKELRVSLESKIKELKSHSADSKDSDDDSKSESVEKLEVKINKQKNEDEDDDSKIVQTGKIRSDDDDDDDRRGTATNPVPVPTPQPNPNPTSAPTPIPSVTSYTLAQVATHNTASNCWSVVNGSVYNLTSWIGQHPGGQSAIKSMCGLDASADFNGQHGGQARPVTELFGFKIGILK